MKRKLFTAFLMLLLGITANAQYANLNIDSKTTLEMSIAYGAEVGAEEYYNEQLRKILADYTEAEAAAATIFASEYLKRQALTNIGIWTSPTENYYYQRIYKTVATKILPKMLTVARLMLDRPQDALYWGNYLMQICSETKSLCLQFETVVTNGRLSFQDINFLDISPECKALFEAIQRNMVNWENMLRILAEAPEHFTKENLKADINTLAQIGTDIALSTAQNIKDRVMQGTNFNDLMEGKITGILDAVASCEMVYGNINAMLSGELMRIVGSPENVHKLLNFSNYNVTSWISDYIKRPGGEYYTQRWYIKCQGRSGEQTVCLYNPPEDATQPEWYKVQTTDEFYYPTQRDLTAALSKSETFAAWSQASVNRLNETNTKGEHYTFKATPSFKQLRDSKGKMYAYAIAYSIHVTRTKEVNSIVYEEIYDSYKMDLAVFKRLMLQKLNRYTEENEGNTYTLMSDDPHFYPVTDTEKLKGKKSVVISVTCHDGAELYSGASTYKCKGCNGTISAHTQQCSFKTSLTADDELDDSDLKKRETELLQEIDDANAEIEALNKRNNDLKAQLSGATTAQSVAIRKEVTQNRERIAELESKISEAQKNLDTVRQAMDDLAADNAESAGSDNFNRIPAIMNECAKMYSLKWNDDGQWSTDTYTRTAQAPKINGPIKFKAKLSVVSKPWYLLWIKIRRGKMKIEYELSASYTDSQVVDIINLDQTRPIEENEKLVNDRISEIAKQYPECDLDTEYIGNDSIEEDVTEDTYHLLWSSDRLRIAQGVDYSLHRIYADLVSMEKMMGYKKSLLDLLLARMPKLDDEKGRRLNIVQKARKEWLERASKVK